MLFTLNEELMQGTLMADSLVCVSALRPDEVLSFIQNDEIAKRTLIIDCRPFMAYNESHFHNAQNIHLPTIIKRRSNGQVDLQFVVHDLDTRTRLQEGYYQHVILYDASMHVYSVHEMEPKSELYLSIRSLCEASITAGIYFVQGGYAALKDYLPQMCSPQGSPSISGEDDFWALEQSLYHTEQIVSMEAPHQVLPWMYIGNADDASRKEQLQMLGISAILNVSDKCCRTQSPVFKYKQIPVTDTANADLSQWFPQAIQFIESIKESGGKVLVHCQAGISRSATVCLAYLMQTQKLTLDQAFDLLRSHRSKVNPNLNFMRQLSEFEGTLGLKKCRDHRVPPLDLCKSEPLCLDDMIWPTSQAQEVPSTPTTKQENIFTFDDIPTA